MNTRKEILKSLTAVFLFLALLFPSVIEFVHFADGHQHIACNDNSEHLHEATKDCSVFHAQLNSFQYQVAFYSQLVIPTVPSARAAIHAPAAVVSFIHTNTQLRAPPVIS